jgi:hypothetical protein
MVLHLMPVPGYDPGLELLREEIRLGSGTSPKTPLLADWHCNARDQIITHRATGCQFHAYRLKSPLVDGFVLPFEHSYEIAAKFLGMKDKAPRPETERVFKIGQEGLMWILTYTYESARRRSSAPVAKAG